LPDLQAKKPTRLSRFADAVTMVHLGTRPERLPSLFNGMALAGLALVVTGVGFVHWPSALILLGLTFILCGVMGTRQLLHGQEK
jgi:hypothetical protein